MLIQKMPIKNSVGKCASVHCINIRTSYIKTNRVNMVSVYCIHKITRNPLWKYIQYILEIMMYIWVLRFYCSWVDLLAVTAAGQYIDIKAFELIIITTHLHFIIRLDSSTSELETRLDNPIDAFGACKTTLVFKLVVGFTSQSHDISVMSRHIDALAVRWRFVLPPGSLARYLVGFFYVIFELVYKKHVTITVTLKHKLSDTF